MILSKFYFVLVLICYFFGQSSLAQFRAHQAFGFVEEYQYPINNHSESSGYASIFLPELNIPLNEIVDFTIVLPFSYSVVDLPAGSANQSWLYGNVSSYINRRSLLFGGWDLDYGLGLSLPTGDGRSDPYQKVFINKSQLIASALSGGHIELYEPGRLSLTPYTHFNYDFSDKISLSALMKVPLLMFIGEDSLEGQNQSSVNEVAIHNMIKGTVSYQIFSELNFELTNTYVSYFKEVIEKENQDQRTLYMLQPKFSLNMGSWNIGIGYTSIIHQFNNIMGHSFIVDLKFNGKNKKERWSPI